MTASAADTALKDQLSTLGKQCGAVGCLLINRNGQAICSTLPDEIDAGRLASIAATLYSNNDVSIQRMNQGNLTQMTLRTNEGNMHLRRIGEHMLVVFTASGQEGSLEDFIEAVDQHCNQLASLIS